MKAIEIKKPGEMRVVEMPKPGCEAGEVLLRIRYVGFCGSDLNSFRGSNSMARYPLIPGHEVGAEIAEVGANVPPTLQPGMTVTVNPYTSCGQCASCRRRRYNACEHNETLGVQRNGAMREYLAVPWQKVIPVSGVSVCHSALIEPMSVGFHAVDRAQVTDPDVVMVIGCGMVGMGAVIRAAVRGAMVIAVDVDDDKLAIVRKVGATHTINSKSEDLHSRLLTLTHGLVPDVVIEAVGSPLTQEQAASEVAFTGRVVCIGYAKQESAFDTSLFVKKELDIRGSRNALPEDFESVVKYLSHGTCPFEQFITKVVKPEEAIEAMRRCDADPGKVFRIVVEL